MEIVAGDEAIRMGIAHLHRAIGARARGGRKCKLPMLVVGTG